MLVSPPPPPGSARHRPAADSRCQEQFAKLKVLFPELLQAAQIGQRGIFMSVSGGSIMLKHLPHDSDSMKYPIYSVKKACFKTLVDEVQELEALSKDPGAVVHGKRYCYTPSHPSCVYSTSFRYTAVH